MSHLDMKVKPFNWTAYLRPFFYKEIVNEIRDEIESLQEIDFLVFLAGIYSEFGVGQKVNRELALSLYKRSIYCPMSAYRLAEIYSEPLHFSQIVQSDFQLSWLYLLFSSAFSYLIDPMNSKESIKKIIQYADRDLENSKQLLQNFFDQNIQLTQQVANNQNQVIQNGKAAITTKSVNLSAVINQTTFSPQIQEGEQLKDKILNEMSGVKAQNNQQQQSDMLKILNGNTLDISGQISSNWGQNYKLSDQNLMANQHQGKINLTIQKETNYSNETINIINLIKLANLNDKLDEKKCFSQLTSQAQTNSFSQLFYLTISHHGQENPNLRTILKFLAVQKQEQLKFLVVLQKIFDTSFAKLPSDHDIFQSFRYAIFEFFHIRILSRKCQPAEIDDKIDIILLNILRVMFENSRHKIKDVTDQTFIIRFYSELLQKKSNDHNRVLTVQNEEFSQQIDPVFFAYAHYRNAQIMNKIRNEKKAAIEELKKAETLFIERFNRPAVQDKFLGAYFLGRIYMKLASFEEQKLEISQILDQSSVSQSNNLPNTPTKLSLSTIVNVPQKACEYFTKALQIYKQRQVEFQSMRTFQFEVLMIKLEKRMQVSDDLMIPSNNFFSINTIRQTQLKTNVSLSQSRITVQFLEIPFQWIQLKSLIRKGRSQLHSAFVKFQKGGQITPCLVKIFSGLSKSQSDRIANELQKWQNIPSLNHFTGLARKNLSKDFEEVYLIQETQKYNLLQAVQNQLNLEQKIDITEQLAIIIAEIHSKGLIHGNLKPTNILFSEERVLIGDYCWPCIIHDELEDQEQVYGYNEPCEQLDQEYDIWSFGVLILQVFSQQILNEKLLQQAQLFDGNLRRMQWLEQAGLKRICNLVNRMLVLPDRKKRLSAQKVLQEIRTWKQIN